jgi:insertion element IS1 protein InsB
MTRVEGENSRLRHYLARLHRKSGKTPRRRKAQGNACQDTFCYSKSIEMLEVSVRLLTYYLKHRTIPVF